LESYHSYKERQDFTTLKGNLGEFNEAFINSKSKEMQTLKSEVLRSVQEVQIANFLYLNQIDYVYEKPYKYRLEGAKKVYTPDFFIKQGDKEYYIEHFGITEEGKNGRYTEEELERYKQNIRDKILHHRKHGTNLIYTFSSYKDGNSLIDHLQEKLIVAGFTLNPRSEKEVFQRIVQLENEKYLGKFSYLASVFLHNYKTNGYDESEFARMKAKTKNVRDRMFLDIMEKVYLFYQGRLRDQQAVDFEDMINESARLIKECKELGKKLPFKYVFVDEYQDISKQRFNLTKAISEVTNAKIIAVGDDWQSIFAFAGSDITLFTEFQKEMGYGKELQITHTYRNAQELIDIAGGFVQKNPSQIKKQLKSPKQITTPIEVRTYSDVAVKNERKGIAGIQHEKGKVLNQLLGEIVAKYGDKSSILMLGRYGFDGERLTQTEFFNYNKMKQIVSCQYPKIKLTFLTVHSSKGLGYDNVILLNASHAIYGFPSQIEDDPVLRFVTKDEKTVDFAEERRLFYVALTRTKNQVFIVAPEKRPSKFVLELIEDNNNISVIGEIAKSVDELKKVRKYCPVCGYPLQFKTNKTYGLELFICTNEPELCDFMTNDMRKPANIRCCEKCDGFMVVKPVQNKGIFVLGCSNHKKDGTGCNNIQSI